MGRRTPATPSGGGMPFQPGGGPGTANRSRAEIEAEHDERLRAIQSEFPRSNLARLSIERMRELYPLDETPDNHQPTDVSQMGPSVRPRSVVHRR